MTYDPDRIARDSYWGDDKFLPGKRFLKIDTLEICELGVQGIVDIVTEYKKHDDLNSLVFSRLGDGIEIHVMDIIDPAVKIITERQLLSFEDIVYVSNVDACVANRAIYTQLQQQYPYLPRHMCHSSNLENLNGFHLDYRFKGNAKLAIDYENKSKNFLCLNRGNRLPRLLFCSEMINRDLHHNSYLSMDSAEGWSNSLTREIYLSQFNKGKEWMAATGFDQVDSTKLLEGIPWSLGYDRSRLFNLSPDDINMYNTSRLSVVNEALYYYSHCDLLPDDAGDFVPTNLTSEKTLKCIMVGHPFICLSTPGSLQSLKELGYKTFSNVIDESYDSIANDYDRMNAVLQELERLNSFTELEWRQFTLGVKDAVYHNQKVYRRKIRKVDFFHWLS